VTAATERWEPIARIDVDALRHNLAQVRQHAPGRRIISVIKANAYGHDLGIVADGLGETDAFAVARLGEAQRLRELGVRRPILVLDGCFCDSELREAARLELWITVHSPDQLALLERTRLPQPLRCWLKLDTGMGRLGLHPAQGLAAFERLRQCRNVRPGTVLMTHLANADDTRDPATERQLARFQPLADSLACETSIANSAGLLAWPASLGDWVRPGLMLYGVSPFPDRLGGDLGLRPVMHLGAPLIAVRELQPGDRVGYGGTWTAPEPMRLGVVGAGYGDGYPREIAAGTRVLLRGVPVPVVGRVSMDMLTVDLRGVDAAAVGDWVTLWGPELPVEELARQVGTIPYTLLCGVTGRVRQQRAQPLAQPREAQA